MQQGKSATGAASKTVTDKVPSDLALDDGGGKQSSKGDDGDGRQSPGKGNRSCDQDQSTVTIKSTQSVWGPMVINGETFASPTEAKVVLNAPEYTGPKEMADYMKDV